MMIIASHPLYCLQFCLHGPLSTLLKLFALLAILPKPECITDCCPRVKGLAIAPIDCEIRDFPTPFKTLQECVGHMRVGPLKEGDGQMPWENHILEKMPD